MAYLRAVAPTIRAGGVMMSQAVVVPLGYGVASVVLRRALDLLFF